MRTLLWAVVIGGAASLVYFMALDLRRYKLSDFALRNLVKGDPATKRLKKINKRLAEISALRQIDLVCLLLLLSGLLVYLEQSLAGIVYAVLITVLACAAAKVSALRSLAAGIFEGHYQYVCQLTDKLKPVLRFIATKHDQRLTINDQAELLDMLQRLPSTVIPAQERHRLELVFEAEDKTVTSIMTPAKRVVSIEPSATLGPIVLSDLQKTGHGYFPVATKKGQPEGMLSLSDVTDIHTAKQRSQVRELMSTHLVWVAEDMSLYDLTRLFLTEKQYVVLVRNLEGEFVGLVTIADVMKHLLGVVKN